MEDEKKKETSLVDCLVCPMNDLSCDVGCDTVCTQGGETVNRMKFPHSHHLLAALAATPIYITNRVSLIRLVSHSSARPNTLSHPVRSGFCINCIPLFPNPLHH